MKHINRLLFGVISLICFLSVNYAQTRTTKPRPSFTGTWLLDRKRSPGLSNTAASELAISHNDPEFRVQRKTAGQNPPKIVEFIYYTDGRGEKNLTMPLISANAPNSTPKVPTDVESRTTWNGNKILTRTKSRSVMMGRTVEFEVRDEWKLSADGNTLTQTSRTIFLPDTSSEGVFVPANIPDVKRVYRKQS